MESSAERSPGKGKSTNVNVPAGLKALAVFCFLAGTMGSISFLSSSIRLSVYTPLPIKIGLLLLGGVSSSLLILAGMGYLEGDRLKGFRMGLIQAAVSFARGCLNVYAISTARLLPIDLFDFTLPCLLVFASSFIYRDVSSRDSNRETQPSPRSYTHAGMLAIRSIAEKYRGAYGICQIAFALVLVLTVTQLVSTPWEAAVKAGAKALGEASSSMEPVLKYLLGIFPAGASQEKLMTRFLLFERIAPLSIVFTVIFAFVPAIVALGSVSSVSSEVSTGMAKITLTRMSRQSYYSGKFFSELFVNGCVLSALSIMVFLYVLAGFRYCLDPLFLPSILEFGFAMIAYSLAWTGFTVMVSSFSDSTAVSASWVLAAIILLSACLWTNSAQSPLPDLSILAWFLPVVPGGHLFNAALPMRITAGLGMLVYTAVYFQIGLFFFKRRSF